MRWQAIVWLLGLTLLQPQLVIGQQATSNDSGSASQVDWAELTQRSPWVFLGDSNTYSGGYVAVLEAWLHRDYPQLKLLNLGVSSETASGLSEVDHPFKRPCVQERVDKVLRLTRPGVVFACYGMNDGIYAPPSPERLAAYAAGMRQLAHQVRASGAIFICLTPPIFEAEPVAQQAKLGPSSEGRYAYFAPFAEYDQVLEQQAAWLRSSGLPAQAVIDIRQPLLDEKQKRLAADSSFTYSKDGVHFGSEAHGLVAETILKAVGAPLALIDKYPSAAEIEGATRRMQLRRDAYLSATGKNRPGLPAGEPVWYAERLAEQIP